MGKVKFFLKDTKADKATLIYLVYNFNNKRFKYSTGETINPIAWDFLLKIPQEKAKFPINSKIRRRIEQYRSALLNHIEEFKKINKQPTSDEFRILLDNEFKPSKSDSKSNENLFQYIERFITECKIGKRTTQNGTLYKDWTIKGYTTLLFHLNTYCSLRKTIIDFNDITMEFYNDFLEYCNINEYALNTIGKHIKNIKVMMANSFDEDLHKCLDFRKKSFRTLSEDSDAIYLNEEELNSIYELDLSSDKKLERVRDMFIVACRTALRYSELANINENNFVLRNEVYFLSTKSLKTGIDLFIPLKKQVFDIFQKHDNKLPRVITNQKMNEYLKLIGEKAEILTKEIKVMTKGGKRVETTHLKKDLITTHTARRSAATNLFLAGFPAISIMKLTGHRTESSFMKYIRMSAEDNAYKMAESAYFKDEYNNSNLKIAR